MPEPDDPVRPSPAHRHAPTSVYLTGPPGDPRDRRRWQKAVLIFVSSLALVGALVAAGLIAWKVGSKTPPQPISISGTLTLHDDDSDWITGELGCRGEGGFSDIGEGASITIRDGTGKVIAVGNLGRSVEDGGACVFRFQVDNVPEMDFYGIEISHRGVVNYSRDQVRGTVQITLGG